jgi:rare lipoprotein A
MLALAIASGTISSTAQTKTAPSPAGQTRYVIGKPYQFDGIWYRPAVDYGYDQTGTAAIYPSRRAGLSTTSGEPYDENAITAAHKTLPLPSVARVTNLDNGKSIELRINDRGPFVDSQIIDLSPGAARLLGISNQAAAHVRVQILAPESEALAASLGAGGSGSLAAAPVPVVKVTGLPLLNGPAVQPLKPVTAPTSAMPVGVAAPQTPVAAAPPLTPLAAPALAMPVAVAAPITPVAAPPLLIPVAVPTPAKPVAVLPPAPPPLNPAPTPAVSATIINGVATSGNTPSPVLPNNGPTASIQPASAPGTAAAPLASAAPVLAPTAVPAVTSATVLQPDSTKIKPLPVDLPAQFFIQAGAFKAPAEADVLRVKLASLGKAKIVPTRLGAAQFSAVLLGPISSMTEAQRLLKQIAAMGYSDAVLIIE